MGTGGRKKSSWVLVALLLVVLVGWLAINIIGGASAVR
jgi:hypothetical protein